MRAAIYLDRLGPDDGCLCVVPGSHFKEYREHLLQCKGKLGTPNERIPGRYPVVNDSRDVLFKNHKLYHAALNARPWRRTIHINCVQNATPEQDPLHFDWLKQFLAGQTEHWGRFYSERLIRTAGPRRKKMLVRAIELGFGNTGRITHLQDQG